MKWLFLVHQVHSKHSRERVKVWRTLKKIGAVLHRNSVYVLPFSKERLEDFQWASQQINDSKGEASVYVSETQDANEDRLLRNLFAKTRTEESESVFQSAFRLNERISAAIKQKRMTERLLRDFEKEFRQLRESFEEVRKIDFFEDVPAKKLARTFQQIQTQLTGEGPAGEINIFHTRSIKDFQRKTWATRERIHIDRLSSAWLIRKFVDPAASFVFAPESQLPADAIVFDVYGAEFSHHGADCTFETLMKAFAIDDPAVRALAEIIHDVDLKDKKFNRPEAPGIDAIVRALAHSIHDDHRLLEAGSALLDALYAFYSSAPANVAAKRRVTKRLK